MIDTPPPTAVAQCDRLVLYLSGSIANGPMNQKLRDCLPADRFELILPQEFTPESGDHLSFPAAIYERCIQEMERCDAGILVLDAFGVDSASEAGWFAARGKPLIGVAVGGVRFLKHWMVKGNMTGVVCLDPTVFEAVHGDPILARVPVRNCAGWEALADALPGLIRREASEVRETQRVG